MPGDDTYGIQITAEVSELVSGLETAASETEI